MKKRKPKESKPRGIHIGKKKKKKSPLPNIIYLFIIILNCHNN